MRKNKSGFTIVELLIVIVVIAILAAISIVAYNGIQARAKLVQQTAELDKIGKAIQLWSAETGKSLGESGAGWDGVGIGSFAGKNYPNYTTTSIDDLLRSAGYLQGEIDASAFKKNDVLLAPCKSGSGTTWAVMTIVVPAPKKPIAEQISDTGCTNGTIVTYTSPPYSRNLMKVY